MIHLEQIQQQVLQAKQLKIIGGNSQVRINDSEDSCCLLDMSQYTGVIEYHPDELVITVKAGTTIEQLNKTLSEFEQTTPFILQHQQHRKKATIGGAYAIGTAALRDAVLGIKIIDGQGRILIFGGQVMKNVAGYDVARLLVGSKGKVAVICEISFKIIPQNYMKSITQQSLLKTSTKINKPSVVKTKLELGIKNIFDPLGRFI
ncbi:MAG: glycolate oxidase FAD binding subunit [Polaribacter sp.]